MTDRLTDLLRSTPPERLTPEALELMARLEEVETRGARLRASILGKLHPKQRAFVADRARSKAALCTRRSGKTYADASILVLAACENPRAWAAYVAVDQDEARRLMWDSVQEVMTAEGVSFKRNDTRLELYVHGGGRIKLWGANDQRAIEKFRGPPYSVAILDEAASFGPHFDKMVKESIGPALADYRGQMVLTGTPGAACIGFFHDVTREQNPAKGWSVHRWSIADNSCFPRWAEKAARGEDWQADVRELLAEEMERCAWDETSPGYLREWCGKWVRDEAGMVYRWSQERNGWDGVLPAGHQFEHVMGVDLGHDDAFAIVVWAYSPRLPDLWCVDRYRQPGLDVTDCAGLIQARIDRYHPHSIMIDTGGLGKMIAEEIRRRHHVSMEPAVKTEKAATIRLMNADFLRGHIHELPDSPYASELSVLQWAAGKAGLVEDAGFENHLCFVAGTRVLTARGEVPIEQVCVGDLALTRSGWKPVTSAGCTGERAVVTRLGITGTPEHPVLTAEGWKRLDSVAPSDVVLYAWNTQGQSSGVAALGIGGLNRAVAGTECTTRQASAIEPCASTERSTRHLTGPSLVDGTCITATATHSTTTSRILRRAEPENTSRSTWPTGGVMLRLSSALPRLLWRGLLRLRGIARKRGARGTESTPGKSLSVLARTVSARSVERLSAESARPSSAPADARGDGTPGSGAGLEWMTSSASAADVAGPSWSTSTASRKTAVVYALSVAEQHEYFANGILVSNCDAGLYGWRKAYAYTYRPDKVAPPPGSAAAAQEEADRMEAERMEAMERRGRR